MRVIMHLGHDARRSQPIDHIKLTFGQVAWFGGDVCCEREYVMHTYEHTELGSRIAISPRLTDDELEAMKRSTDAAYAAIDRDMAAVLYGDPPKVKPVSWRLRLSHVYWRVKNAWDVLRGNADIC